MPIKTWEKMGFTRVDFIPTKLRLAAATRRAIYVAGRTPITHLQMRGLQPIDEFSIIRKTG